MIISQEMPSCVKVGSKKPENITTPALELCQSWSNSMPQDAGTAYVGHSKEGLRFYTHFEDSFQFTTATENNQRLFELGSVVEFFIVPEHSNTYWEIHLSPNNLIMDIKIPDNAKLLAHELNWDDLICHSSQATYTVVCNEESWATEITIPWKTFERAGIPTGEMWRFAVCRYNYRGDLEHLEYSATAPFTKLSYHQLPQYHQLQF